MFIGKFGPFSAHSCFPSKYVEKNKYVEKTRWKIKKLTLRPQKLFRMLHATCGRSWPCFIKKTFSIIFIGLRLGKIYDVTTPIPYEPSFQWTITCPFFVPKRLVALGLVQLYLDQFDYGIDKAFKQLNCNTKVWLSSKNYI